ncbi:unnamed protein product [Microthlaspi erraticum]|uniref:Uncharacterized protein n=1 Tax=Microthlaspi erraticum TaxID=1685480 RepID=A0A6D2JTR2_9BRAS|nr:unnamed protein product [Microthlaspi erraticum]
MASKLKTFINLHGGYTATLSRQNRSVSSSNPSSRILEPVHQSHYRKQILLANLLQSRDRELARCIVIAENPQKSLVKLISDCPHVLRSEFLRKWRAPISDFVKFGLSSSAITSVLEYSSRIGIGPEKFHECTKILKFRIEFLIGINIPRENIERFFHIFPEILGIGELSRCLELIKTLKCREVIRVSILSEGLFRAGFQVKLRIDCLCRYGLIHRDAFKVVWREPRVILYEIDEIEKKIEFLTNRMGFHVSCLADVPEYLGVNLQKQIVPRYNVIDYLKLRGGLGCEIGLKGLIKPSMKRFYNLYVKPYPECERIFEKRRENARVKQRHPPGLWKLMKPSSHVTRREDVVNMKSFMESSLA